jgi:hypothetical protein
LLLSSSISGKASGKPKKTLIKIILSLDKTEMSLDKTGMSLDKTVLAKDKPGNFHMPQISSRRSYRHRDKAAAGRE